MFIFTQDNSHVTLHPILRTHNERTSAVEDVVKCLGEEVIPGIRNEVLLQITKMIILILPFACRFVLSNALICSSSDLFTSECVLHIGAQVFFLSFWIWFFFFVTWVKCYWHWFSSAISCCIIFWGTGVFLTGTWSSSLFWDKGQSCLCIFAYKLLHPFGTKNYMEII